MSKLKEYAICRDTQNDNKLCIRAGIDPLRRFVIVYPFKCKSLELPSKFPLAVADNSQMVWIDPNKKKISLGDLIEKAKSEGIETLDQFKEWYDRKHTSDNRKKPDSGEQQLQKDN